MKLADMLPEVRVSRETADVSREILHSWFNSEIRDLQEKQGLAALCWKQAKQSHGEVNKFKEEHKRVSDKLALYEQIKEILSGENVIFARPKIFCRQCLSRHHKKCKGNGCSCHHAGIMKDEPAIGETKGSSAVPVVRREGEPAENPEIDGPSQGHDGPIDSRVPEDSQNG